MKRKLVSGILIVAISVLIAVPAWAALDEPTPASTPEEITPSSTTVPPVETVSPVETVPTVSVESPIQESPADIAAPDALSRRVRLPLARQAPMPAPAQPTPAPAGGIYWGAHLDGVPWDMNKLAAWEAMAGKPMSIVHYWQFWHEGGAPRFFRRDLLDKVRSHGSIPLITWSPMRMGGGEYQPDFQLADIIAGSHDAYLRQWATDAKAWGHPFMIRFAHEMNGDWFPWGEDTNGNARGQFVQAWRRVHGIFTSVGARNVSWVWCPNMDFPRSPRPTYASLYPGDAYVDWTCLDGYNWGPNYPLNGGWISFANLFGLSYNNLLAVAPSKPVMLAEFASTEYGGSKGGWIADALSVQIPRTFPRIRAVLWYNRIDTGMDWPIESSQGSINAWKAAIASPYYLANLFGALEVSETQAVPEP